MATHIEGNGTLAQVPTDPKHRPRYAPDELQTYFRRIRLPKRYTTSPVCTQPELARTKEHGLPLIQALMLHHLANVPFENLEIHYSARKTISLNMDDLYVKFAERGLKYGRGGRCMVTDYSTQRPQGQSLTMSRKTTAFSAQSYALWASKSATALVVSRER